MKSFFKFGRLYEICDYLTIFDSERLDCETCNLTQKCRLSIQTCSPNFSSLATCTNIQEQQFNFVRLFSNFRVSFKKKMGTLLDHSTNEFLPVNIVAQTK